jgi:hypothetical protein
MVGVQPIYTDIKSDAAAAMARERLFSAPLIFPCLVVGYRLPDNAFVGRELLAQTPPVIAAASDLRSSYRLLRPCCGH